MADVIYRNIYKVYANGTKAVNNFTMEIVDGEFIVVVGPSGCGKSTVLRMTAGLEPITAGELIIGGVISNDVEPKDRDIAMVFQNYALYPHMTVYENIAFGLKMRKVPKEEIDRRVHEAAEILGITEYLNKKPKEMSGGQRQRVALGRAIVRNPKLMLLDEPLSNLDAKLRNQMRSEISKLHEKLKTTFLYVTHDQIEAMTMGTRIVVMRDGFVQQIDTPKNLYNYPANKFVAGFIGTPQMNFLEGTLKKNGEQVDISFVGTDAKITVPYSYFYKAKPKYLDGETVVVIGLRAEDISLEKAALETAQATLRIKVSHTEQLGNETQIYGDINMDYDGFAESPTRIILKGKDEEIENGAVITAALNLNHIHLFDKETEESILPRIPETNTVQCEVRNGELHFLGQTIKLPPAIKNAEQANELIIPSDAIHLGGRIPAKIVGVEKVGNVNLLAVELGGRRLFFVAGEEVAVGDTRIDIDLKHISLWHDGEEIVAPLPRVNSFNGKFQQIKAERQIEQNGKVKNKKAMVFVLSVGGAQFDAPDDITQKLINALTTRGALKSDFIFECAPADMTVGAGAMKVAVLENLDYGTEQFAKCDLNGQTIYIKTDKELSGEVSVSLNLANLAVIQRGSDIRLV